MVKKKEKEISEEKLKHKARGHSIKEGIFAAGSSSFGERYVSPFAIAINASNSMVAMLSSIAGLLGPLSQTFSSSRLMEKYSRKRIVLRSVFWASLAWFPFIILAFMFYKGIVLNFLPMVLMFIYAIHTTLLNLPSPAWFSWMGDLVDKKHRGRFFSKRNLILGFITFGVALLSSFLLDYFKKNEWAMYGFMILFFFAFISKIISWKFLKVQYEPKLKLQKGHYFSFFQFLKEAPKNNFGRFSIFRALLSVANNISAPLMAVYLLRYLEFSYKTYIIVTLASAVYTFLVLELWGKFSDKYGNYRTLKITSLLIPFIPLLWILSPSPIYMVLVPAAIGGIGWTGFNLAAGNFIYDNVGQQKRGLAVSYYNLLMGIGIFIGAAIGAILIKYLNTNFIEPLFFIFLLSFVLRFIVVLFGMHKIKEVRRTKKFKGAKSIEDVFLKHAKPTLVEEFHEIIHIKKYLTMK